MSSGFSNPVKRRHSSIALGSFSFSCSSLRPVQAWNTPLPIFSIQFETIKLVRFSHPRNAASLILVTLSGIRMFVKFLQPENVPSSITVILSGISTLIRPSQSQNAKSPMLVTLLGISIFTRPLQPRNAQLLILVTLLGILDLAVPAKRILPLISSKQPLSSLND